MDLNRATIIGRLTRDPEMRTTPNGRSVTTIALATNRSWTDQAGAKQEKVEYHNCVLWGKLAEIAGQYLAKGRRAYVEGRIETRDWTDQSGVKKYRTEIVVENLIMLDGPRSAGSGAPMPADAAQGNPPPKDDDASEIRVEDIPF
jgi:single-strand DNA-binding protein